MMKIDSDFFKKNKILNLQLQQRRVGLPTESSQPAIGRGNIFLQGAKSSVGFSNGHWGKTLDEGGGGPGGGGRDR